MIARPRPPSAPRETRMSPSARGRWPCPRSPELSPFDGRRAVLVLGNLLRQRYWRMPTRNTIAAMPTQKAASRTPARKRDVGVLPAKSSRCAP